MIRDLVFSSEVRNGDLILKMSEEVSAAMNTLRTFLYDNVYRSPRVHNEFVKAKKILTELYECLLNRPDIFKKELSAVEMSWFNYNDLSHERSVCDFIASMTDRCALNLYEKIFFPSPLI